MALRKPYSTTRKPTAAERKAAAALSKRLRKVAYPGREKTKVRTALPPGRIDMREAAVAQRQRRMRVEQTAKPFVEKRKAPVKHTPIKVGLVCDISGSMRQAQEPLAVARWVLADAINQVNGEVATVLMGAEAYPVQRPKERLTEIEEFNGVEPREHVEDAFTLLDAGMNLIDGEGARLMVVMTDGQFVKTGAPEYAEKFMAMCRDAGVAVIWLHFGSSERGFARADCYGWGSLKVVGEMTPVQIAEVLGEAVIDEFRRVAPQHMLHTA